MTKLHSRSIPRNNNTVPLMPASSTRQTNDLADSTLKTQAVVDTTGKFTSSQISSKIAAGTENSDIKKIAVDRMSNLSTKRVSFYNAISPETRQNVPIQTESKARCEVKETKKTTSPLFRVPLPKQPIATKRAQKNNSLTVLNSAEEQPPSTSVKASKLACSNLENPRSSRAPVRTTVSNDDSELSPIAEPDPDEVCVVVAEQLH